MSAANLDDVLTRLRAKYVGNDMALRPVCTRLLLRTGVNLQSPRPDQVRDGAVVAKVVAELSSMGIAL